VEDAYDLTPMQHGILFHSRLEAAAADGEKGEIYVVQLHCALLGPLDLGAFRDAWQRVVERHAVLRTSFHWSDQERPQQVVHRGVQAPLTLIDWQNVAAPERACRFADLLAGERRRGFELTRAPLLRVILVRLAARERRLVFAFHHLLLDGWSMPLLFDELLRLYEGCRRGAPPALPPPRPFRDFVDWLRRQDGARAEAFWRRELAGFRTPTPVPVEAWPGTPGAAPPRYTRQSRLLSAAETAALQVLARRHHLTMSSLVLGAWALMLARYAGVRDVLFGATSAGRPADLPEVEEMLGLFINTLPVRVPVDPEAPLGAWLTRLQERLAALRELEHCSLADVQRASEVPPGTPLFASVVIFENYPFRLGAAAGAGTAGGGAGRLRIAGVQAVQNTNYPLALVGALRGDQLLLRLAYDAGRTTTPPPARAVAQTAALLREMALDAARERQLGALSPLDPAERHQLLHEWSGTSREPAVGPPLHQLFERQAAAAPAAPALVFGDLTLSYAEVDGRATRLASALRRLGAGRPLRRESETLVAVALRRSPWLPITLLAIWKAGGAWLPLDPSYPRERLAFMLADSGAGLLLAEPDLRRELPCPPGLRTTGVEELLAAAGAAGTGGVPDAPARQAHAEAPPEPGDLAYVIYTSGSTGTPKGVMIGHRGLANLVREQIAAFGVTPASRVLQLASCSFDASVSEVWTAWAAGAALVMAPDSVPVGEGLVRLLREQRVSVATIPPSLLASLPPAELPSLATLVVAGEVATGGLLARWAPGRRRVLNAYGPTEASVCATVERCRPGAGEPLLGRAIANVGIYLLDPRQQPVPIGAVGEICLSGVGLARGYLGRPALTAERFLPDPWSPAPGGRLYRSGDLARFGADGRLAFLGRRDTQVKVRGVRIEIGEIEAALASHPGVQAAAVVARREAADEAGLQLAAFVVAAAGAGAAADEPDALAERLRAYLRRRLPEPMVPGRFTLLAALPRTPAGKLDRDALARGEQGLAAPGRPAAHPSAPPRGNLERILAALWCEVLGVAEVGIDDNFFQLGGHSLSGATLVGRLQEQLGEIVHVVVMYDAPTVRSLAAYLGELYPAAVARLSGAADAPAGPPPPAIPGSPDAADVPLGPVAASRFGELRRVVARERRRERAAVMRGAAAAAPSTGRAAAPNPPVLFVLSPPRSGSTLLRVMLAGHPRLFAPPELELLGFESLTERRAAFSGRHGFWLEGVVRALMEIHGCDAAAAAARVAALERRGATSQDLYREVQLAIAPRLLVDKTPSYALEPEVLARAEALFDGARYVHLLRHPQAMIRSFEEARLEQVFFRFPHRFARRELAELIWQVSQENIVAFLAGVPEERQLQLRFEELVADPAAELGRLCRWLGLDFHPDMARPYERQQSRMTDGIHPWSRMLGDVKFHAHRDVDPAIAVRWRQAMRGHLLAPPTAELAARLGYGPPPAPASVRQGRRGRRARPAVTPSTSQQSRRRQGGLVALQPSGSRPPLVCIHPAGGSVLCYRELARALDPEQPVFGLEAQGMADGEAPLSSMEAIAERSLAILLTALPQGPYRLLGWSFGGLVAYEVACRLAASGRGAELLAILDAGPEPAAAPATAHPRLDGADLLAAAFQSILPVTADQVRAMPPDEWLPRLLGQARDAGKLPAGIDLAHARRLLAAFQAHQRAARAYRPGSYPGRVILVRATGAPRAAGPALPPAPDAAGGAGNAREPRRDPTLEWSGLAAAVEVLAMPGEHEQMVAPPYLDALVEHLRRSLQAL
jgi:amino acid adenylation domain-containing protein